MEIEGIYYKHYRNYKDECGKVSTHRYYKSGDNKSKWHPASTGGKTECITLVSYGGETFEIMASAKCNTKDLFCYKTGREVAYFRLQQLLGHIKALENITEERLNDVG